MSKGAASMLALRLVEGAPFYSETLDLESSDEGHSLHSIIPFPHSGSADVVSHYIERYTKRGQVVLDPFSGSGTTALEAALRGRVAFASDISALATRIASAKLRPADITEVTLRLQKANLRRPIKLDAFRGKFSPFFDTDTFREIVNLRAFLREWDDRVSRFIELVVLSILHGHSAGFLSVYTFPQIALSPTEQEELNLKRRQSPDYRALLPRALRKTASALRDGIPSVLQALERNHRVAQQDARNLTGVETASVDLILSSPPLPGMRDFSSELWLRNWFCQTAVGAEEIPDVFAAADVGRWSDFMNEVLLEGARVCKPGGRCVLELREVQPCGGADTVRLDDEVRTIVSEFLSRYWEPECVHILAPQGARLRDAVRPRAVTGAASRMLVLRRR